MKITIIIIGLAICLTTAATVYAHSGGLDSYNCHNNNPAGEKHCHIKKVKFSPLAAHHERGSYIHQELDDPATTDDESNNQPLGLFGTETVQACTPHNERCYTLDAKFNDKAIEQVYFYKGSYLTFQENSCAKKSSCRVKAKDGRTWVISRD